MRSSDISVETLKAESPGWLLYKLKETCPDCYAQKLSMTIDKEKHATIKPNLNRIYIQVKLNSRHWNENYSLKGRLTTPKKQQQQQKNPFGMV